jgi:hypothetical protein
MSSNSSYIADLNLLAPPPPISSDDLSAEDFEFWRNARFIEMPPRLETDDELAATDVVDLEDSGPAEASAATAATATPTTATPAQTFSGLELMGLSNMTPTAAATAAALAMSPLFAFNPMATQTLQQQLLLPSVGSAAPAAPTSANGYPTIYPAPPVPVSNVAGSNDTANVNALGTIQPKPPARKSSSTSRRSTLRPTVGTTTNAEAKASDAGTIDTDLVAKIASEEDKRRRNTAASARFRIKKKMKEQALEHTAREMTEKVQQLQERVKELELENKWLRELIVEKDPVLLEYGRSGKRKRPAPSSVQDDDDDDDDDEDEEEDEIEERDKRKGKKKNTISVTKEVNRNRNDHVRKQDQKRPKRNKREVQEAKPEEVIKPGLIKVEQLDIEDEKPI